MEYLKLMRPKHYIKNLLIFLPLVFSGMFFTERNFFKTFFGYICFCLVASCIYIINDIKDRKKDKKHTVKCKRPIASGKISVKNAILQMYFLMFITLLLMFVIKLPIKSIFLILVYFIINLGYSFGLKNIPLLDVAIIALGFIIRVLYGASILNIDVSNWLYLTVFSAAFYLGLGKRRNEITKNGQKSRTVLKYYSQEFLDKNMYMCLSMAIIFYSLWATNNPISKTNHNLLIWTVPLVIVICMKYSMNVEWDNDGDPTEVIFQDKYLVFLSLLLILILFITIYI